MHDARDNVLFAYWFWIDVWARLTDIADLSLELDVPEGISF